MINDQAKRLRNRLQTGEHSAKTIAIVSGKGGVGKSSTIINLSLTLQQKGKKVLLIDLDVGMGNIDIMLGNHSKYSIMELFNEFMSIHDIIEVGPFGLPYIAGGTGLSELFQMDADKYNRFKLQYTELVEKYDYIFFDLGAGVTHDSMSFVLAADECYVVTTPEPTAITDAYSMIKHINHENSDMPIAVIVNQCHHIRQANEVTTNFKKVILKFLNKEVNILGTLPKDSIVQTSIIKQTPYVILNKNAPVSKAMNKLVSDMLANQAENKLKSRLSFVERLKQLLHVR